MTSLHSITHTQVPSEPLFNLRVYYLSEVSPHLQRGTVNRLTVRAVIPPVRSKLRIPRAYQQLFPFSATARLHASHEDDFASGVPQTLKPSVKAKLNVGTDLAL